MKTILRDAIRIGKVWRKHGRKQARRVTEHCIRVRKLSPAAAERLCDLAQTEYCAPDHLENNRNIIK